MPRATSRAMRILSLNESRFEPAGIWCSALYSDLERGIPVNVLFSATIVLFQATEVTTQHDHATGVPRSKENAPPPLGPP